MDKAESAELLRLFLHDANRENANGTHRGLVLVWASIVDDVLLRMLKAHFISMNSDQRDSLYGPLGPAGAFSSRTKLCFALGLILRDEMDLIDELRSIRNKFAHKIGVDLNDPELASRCREFGRALTGESGSGGAPKLLFSGGCVSLLSLLLNRLSRIVKVAGFPDDRSLPDRAYGVPSI